MQRLKTCSGRYTHQRKKKEKNNNKSKTENKTFSGKYVMHIYDGTKNVYKTD
jgi:hypothetical protein